MPGRHCSVIALCFKKFKKETAVQTGCPSATDHDTGRAEAARRFAKQDNRGRQPVSQAQPMTHPACDTDMTVISILMMSSAVERSEIYFSSKAFNFVKSFSTDLASSANS
jgi:hypothetical protein